MAYNYDPKYANKQGFVNGRQVVYTHSNPYGWGNRAPVAKPPPPKPVTPPKPPVPKGYSAGSMANLRKRTPNRPQSFDKLRGVLAQQATQQPMQQPMQQQPVQQQQPIPQQPSEQLIQQPQQAQQPVETEEERRKRLEALAISNTIALT